MKKRKKELAPCGVFCGACPSFNKTCFGCSSENTSQKRTSKWNCKIRKCCYASDKNYCVECMAFPCKIINHKLINSHLNNDQYKYRHEIPEVFHLLNEMSVNAYLAYQKKRWECPYCGGIVYFYKYKCSKCGKNIKI